ncbi:MAG TPA: hypothetical protein VFW33_18055 [Gemmataceae bacterium]|nr:hypothetical protein [Gemmataceae bacterium]
MIAELFRYFVTPCPRYVRAMGYLDEQVSIKARHDRCRRVWEPHLERTKEVIRAAMRKCSARRKAVVFGSGMLLDVPLPELAAAFGQVVLVDVVHPMGAGWRLANVTALAADVTGTAEAVYRLAKRGGEPLPRVAPQLFCDDPEVDLVASVNLLSQLPYLPCKYLSAGGRYTAEEITAYGREVVLAHIDYLRRLPGVVALVCDRERLTADHTGTLVERLSALRGVELPWSGEEWVWDLAPRGEASPIYSYQRHVVGIPNVKAARDTLSGVCAE